MERMKPQAKNGVFKAAFNNYPGITGPFREVITFRSRSEFRKKLEAWFEHAPRNVIPELKPGWVFCTLGGREFEATDPCALERKIWAQFGTPKTWPGYVPAEDKKPKTTYPIGDAHFGAIFSHKTESLRAPCTIAQAITEAINSKKDLPVKARVYGWDEVRLYVDGKEFYPYQAKEKELGTFVANPKSYFCGWSIESFSRFTPWNTVANRAKGLLGGVWMGRVGTQYLVDYWAWILEIYLNVAVERGWLSEELNRVNKELDARGVRRTYTRPCGTVFSLTPAKTVVSSTPSQQNLPRTPSIETGRTQTAEPSRRGVRIEGLVPNEMQPIRGVFKSIEWSPDGYQLNVHTSIGVETYICASPYQITWPPAVPIAQAVHFGRGIIHPHRAKRLIEVLGGAR